MKVIGPFGPQCGIYILALTEIELVNGNFKNGI